MVLRFLLVIYFLILSSFLIVMSVLYEFLSVKLNIKGLKRLSTVSP